MAIKNNGFLQQAMEIIVLLEGKAWALFATLLVLQLAKVAVRSLQQNVLTIPVTLSMA
jgi:hypothetical protein